MKIPASNCRDVYRFCIGRKIIGVLFDALPAGRTDLNSGNATFVFDDGHGLTIASNGSHWIESPLEIERAITPLQHELELNLQRIRDVLALAGKLPVQSPSPSEVPMI